MSSLQMGQTRRELAEAAPPTGPLLDSRATLLAISSVSVVEVCELEASDRELSEGVSCCGRCGMTAGDSERPLPKTRPPPNVLRDAILHEAARGRQAEWLVFTAAHSRVY